MSDIPGLFNVKAERGEGSGLQPFSYSQEAKVFNIGDRTIAVVEFDPYNYNPYIPDLGIDPEGIPIEDIPNHPALIPGFGGGLIAGPKLHTWAETHPEGVDEAYAVMAEAYAAFLDEPLGESGERDATTHMGFSSGVREQGGIGLQVLGNCACMGPGLYGFIVHGQFEHGFSEYELHNADTQPQRASLYAGMGHLARLASAEP